MARILLIASMAVLLAAAVVLAVVGWGAAGDVAIGAHGWIALTLGVTLTAAVGGGLMALVFYSSRSGHDEAAHYEEDGVDPEA